MIEHVYLSIRYACPGLSDEDLRKDLRDHRAFWDRVSKRPKEKVKFSFADKQQFDYVREITSKNVWYESLHCSTGKKHFGLIQAWHHLKQF